MTLLCPVFGGFFMQSLSSSSWVNKGKSKDNNKSSSSSQDLVGDDPKLKKTLNYYETDLDWYLDEPPLLVNTTTTTCPYHPNNHNSDQISLSSGGTSSSSQQSRISREATSRSRLSSSGSVRK